MKHAAIALFIAMACASLFAHDVSAASCRNFAREAQAAIGKPVAALQRLEHEASDRIKGLDSRPFDFLRDEAKKAATSATRDTVAREIAEKSGAAVLPPFDDWRIMAGAGTVGLEIVEEWPEVETIVTPLGGGGLLSGVATAATALKPGVDVYGVEPRAGNDGEQSFKSGRIVTIDPPQTIADGARTLAIGERNFAVIRERVRDIVSVTDDVLLDAVKLAMYRTKLVIEPTGALGIAALLSGAIKPKGRTAIVVSGGNLDFTLLCR